VGALSLVSQGESAVAEQPGDRPFDLSAVPPEPFAGLDSRAGDPRDQAPAAEPGDVVGGEVRLVSAYLDRSPPARSASGAGGRYRQEQRLERLAVVQIRPGHHNGQRDALGIGQDVQFAALLASISRIRPGQGASLFARTEAASMIAEVQSTSPLAPSSSVWAAGH
jgi:hypothetical protein